MTAEQVYGPTHARPYYLEELDAMAISVDDRLLRPLRRLRQAAMTALATVLLFPAAASAAEPIADGAPAAPTALSASAGDGEVTLTFAPSAPDAEIARYQVLRTGAGENWMTYDTQPAAGGARTLRIDYLTNGQQHSWKIRAVDVQGDLGHWSASVQATPVGEPDAPTLMAVNSRNATLQVIFAPPATNGGSAVTEYQASTDGGETWAALTYTEDEEGNLAAVLTGLTNDTEYDVVLRALNASGPGPGSVSERATPYRAQAPARVTATAGVASITAEWAEAEPSDAVVGYVVTATPGPATCETDEVSDTSCVLGAEAGVAYRVVVKARAENGTTSVASEASNEVTPTAPEIADAAPEPEPGLALTTEELPGDIAQSGDEILLSGEGYAPFSTVRLLLYSAPTVLGTVVTDEDGAFRIAVAVPAELAGGRHTFLASGVDPFGVDRALTLPVVVSGDAPRRSRAEAGTGSVGDLLRTSAQLGGLGAVGGAVLAAGLLLVLLARRRRSPANQVA